MERRARWLVAAVEVVAVLDVLAAASLAGLSLARSTTKVVAGHSEVPAGSRAGRPGSGTRTGRTQYSNEVSTVAGKRASTATATTPTTAATTTATPTTATTTTAPPTTVPPTTVPVLAHPHTRRPLGPASGGPKPVLLAISPASSAPGQVVTLEGKGFFSQDGHITVMFGPRAAPVYCPTETTCHATVPGAPGGRPATVLVTIATETGVSNSVSFTYTVVAPAAPARGPKHGRGTPAPR